MRLDHLTAQIGDAFGTAGEISFSRTLLYFYLRHRPSIERVNALAAVRINGCGALKAQMGLLASRFGAAHPLKACMHCGQQDWGAEGLGHWTIENQWPGVWTCHRCGTPLEWTTARIHGGDRFAWLLPRQCTFRSASKSSLSDQVVRQISTLGENILAMMRLPPDTSLEPDLLQRTYLSRMINIGCASPSGRIDVRHFSALVRDVTHNLALIDELESLPTTSDQAKAQFLRLVRSTHRPAHPLRHIVLIQALFGHWSTFWSDYQLARCSGDEDQDAREAISAPPALAARRQRLIDLMALGYSVTRASAELGVATATGIAWATERGVHIAHRPSVLMPERRARAIALLRAGGSKLLAAKRAGVSVSTINMLLKSEPGLREQWNAAVFQRAQRAARKAWERTSARISAPSIKSLRALQPAVYIWLYRNDRAWMEDFNRSLPSATRVPRQSIDWDRRDQTLARDILAARQVLDEENPGAHTRLADLCDRVHGLKKRLSQLDHLPLTRKALGRRRRSRSTTQTI